MRTTVTIDDALLDRVRRRAVETGQTVSQVLEDSVREKLSRIDEASTERYALPTFHGGRPRGSVDLDDNAALLGAMDEP